MCVVYLTFTTNLSGNNNVSENCSYHIYVKTWSKQAGWRLVCENIIEIITSITKLIDY